VNVHHKRAAAVLIGTAVLNVALGTAFGFTDQIGVLHGLYCSTATATTVGCDVTPRNAASYTLSFLMLLTIVPLFASVFAFFTTGLTADHVDAQTTRQTQDLKQHVTKETTS
jgi:hypothetical protein